jgi:hypothetical protein
MITAVLRIRMGLFSIPDLGNFFTSKNLSILTPKNWFLSSRKYNPGCSSQIQIPDPDPDFLPIPDPGVEKAQDPGSGSALDTGTVSFQIQ